MAIQEGLVLAQFGIDAVASGLTQGQPIAGSIGYDLNADFGNGPDPRKAQYPGQTGELMMRVDVTADFVEGSVTPGVPHLQFHVLAATTATTFITSGANDFMTIGSNVGPFDAGAGGETYNGYLAADLVVGNSFFVRINPWSTNMGRGIADIVTTAGGFIAGRMYEILTVGSTDYTLVGATSSTVGVKFRATGIGAGTGTANPFYPAPDLRYIGLAITVPEAEGNTGGGAAADPYFSAGAVIGSLVLQSDIAWDPADFIYPSAFTVK